MGQGRPILVVIPRLPAPSGSTGGERSSRSSGRVGTSGHVLHAAPKGQDAGDHQKVGADSAA